MLYVLLLMAGAWVQSPDAAPQTVAERSAYRATARSAEVQALVDDLAARSDHVTRVDIGRSVEGRPLSMLVLADPPVADAAAAAADERLVVMAFGNIHAGEVCGKEALLMLAREWSAPRSPLLDELIILLLPNLNPDGNDRMRRDHRPGQIGPAEGMGQRPNAAGRDLNRDFVKLETPEVRALVTVLNTWDPAVVIDTHTTNGSHHRYTLTYAVPRHPAGDEALLRYARDTMMPDVSRRMQLATGYRSFFYGNFADDHTRWETYPDDPRFGTPYRGLRNRIGILSEAYAYASYRDRVLATRAFVTACAEFSAAHRAEIDTVVREADAAAIAAGAAPDDEVAIRTRLAPFDNKVTIPGFVEAEGRATTRPRDYDVDHYGRFVPTHTVRRPNAYLFSAEATALTATLQHHGIEVHELREDLELDIEVYRADRVEVSARPFQGHLLQTLDVTARSATRLMPAGTRVVYTAQPLGHLIVFLLEPGAQDGLCTWGLCGPVQQGRDVLVQRLPAPADLFTVALPTAESTATPRAVDFDVVYGKRRVAFGGKPLRLPAWLPDGRHYLAERDDQLLQVDARTGRARPVAEVERVQAALQEQTGLPEKTARRIAKHPTGFDDAFKNFVFRHDNDLYAGSRDGALARRLTTTPDEREELFSISPAGTHAAFVRDRDLHLVDLATGAETALTSSESIDIRHGKADWVYFEEVFGRDWRAYWWSPDGQAIALLRFDDTAVGTFAVLDHMPALQAIENTRYPKAGTPNPVVQLEIVDVASRELTVVELPAETPEEFLITGVGWKPDSTAVWFYVQNRIQNLLDLCVAPVTGGTAGRLFRETTGAWVEPSAPPEFLEDGSFLWTSERSGWRHILHFEPDGGVRRAVTSGPWQVTRLHHVDVANDWAYFTGQRDHLLGQGLYRVHLDGTGFENLTSGRGTHRVAVSPNGALFIASSSTLDHPPQVRLCDASGTSLRWLDTNPVTALSRYRFSPVEQVRIPTADGGTLYGTLRCPPDAVPGQRYPVWFMTYAGPQSPTVRDAWPRDPGGDQLLANMGTIVFRCDPRNANGLGARYSWPSYRQLGVPELADITTAIQWVTRRDDVDPQRIGMSGHSYGGFITAFAMTHSTLFAAGISGAPVTDWRNYDTIYTERYMDTPQNNESGYAATSVVDAASDLHGRLLLLHGSMDDNVHVANSLQLVRALQRAEKDFELMIYPQSRHGLRGRHYQRLKLDFIRRTLLSSN